VTPRLSTSPTAAVAPPAPATEAPLRPAARAEPLRTGFNAVDELVHHLDAPAEPWTVERVFDMFPRLGERASNRGNHLSGGEQQMLAIGRALMTNPLLLVLDEATEGLAPKIREEIWAKLDELKKTGLAIIIIDKDVEALCAFADRHYILEKGEVIWTGSTADLTANKELQDRYLGV